MTERINLRQLDYFVAAAEANTMTAAAQRLHVSQSAVSVGIAELERQLGAQLLLRHKAKGLTLTGAGRRLLPSARALLARADEVQDSVRELGQKLAGRLVIGCFTTIAPLLLPGILEDFHTAHPEVTVDFLEGSLVKLQNLLLEGICELAILYDVNIRQDIEYEVLYETKPYVLLPPNHSLAADRSVRLNELDGKDMIMLDVSPSYEYFSELLISSGVEPKIRHRTTSFEMVRSLVARGVGYSLLIQHPVVDVSYEGRKLEVRPIRDSLAPMPVVLAWPAGAQLTRRAEVFARFCHDRVAGTESPPSHL